MEEKFKLIEVLRNKLNSLRPFTDGELERLAEEFGISELQRYISIKQN